MACTTRSTTSTQRAPRSTFRNPSIPPKNRDFLLAQTGVDLYGYARSSTVGALDYRAYGGTIFLDTITLVRPGGPYELLDLTVPYVLGGRLLWETPLDGLRVGGSVQALRLDATLLTNAKSVRVQVPPVSNSSDPTLFPSSSTVSERAYAIAAYRVTHRSQTGTYYSVLFPDVDHRDGRANRQHDLAGTLCFDVNMHWLVKLEAH